MDLAEGWSLEHNQRDGGTVGAGLAGLLPFLSFGRRTAGTGGGWGSDLGLEKALSCAVPPHQSGQKLRPPVIPRPAAPHPQPRIAMGGIP